MCQGLNFWVKKMRLLKMNKSLYYHFAIFLTPKQVRRQLLNLAIHDIRGYVRKNQIYHSEPAREDASFEPILSLQGIEESR